MLEIECSYCKEKIERVTVNPNIPYFCTAKCKQNFIQTQYNNFKFTPIKETITKPETIPDIVPVIEDIPEQNIIQLPIIEKVLSIKQIKSEIIDNDLFIAKKVPIERNTRFNKSYKYSFTKIFKRTCILCENKYDSISGSSQFCSDECRESYNSYNIFKKTNLITTDTTIIDSNLSSKGYVYFIGADSSNLIKIGYSNNIAKRLLDLLNMSPIPIKVILIIKGCDFSIEGAFHSFFKDSRHHGEWFNQEPILEYINTIKNDLSILDNFFSPHFSPHRNRYTDM